MTKDTLEFLKQILDQVSIKADNPQFDVICQTISKARNELNEALKQS
jgi:hypothetical protein